MTKLFDRNNPIWHQHNIVITISILALLITLPLTVLIVATTDRPADVRSRAMEITGKYGPHHPTPTSTTGTAPSCQKLLDLATNRWRASCGDENYDPRADINKDREINTIDVSLITSHISDESWCAEKLQDETNPCLEATPTPPSGPMCRADFNRNGDIDIEDLQVFIDEAQQDCSIPLPTPTPIPCETNADCSPDFGICQQGFCRQGSGPTYCRADFNRNGDIDIEDLQVLMENAQKDCSIAATPIPTLTPTPPTATPTPTPDLCDNDKCDTGETIENCPRDCNNDI